ncbi:MAG TPA: YciI family protein [Solirubrobacteraceae bacterium]|nr:YciI family protein [Solirubrobacteraceae bacterium]
MQYALLIYSKPGSHEELSEAEYQAVRGEYFALRDEPGFVEGAQLQPVHTATTVRVQDGRVLTTDGPFADTKEVFGGYYVFEADNLDWALELAARIPAARLGGSVEVRPLVPAPVGEASGR